MTQSSALPGSLLNTLREIIKQSEGSLNLETRIDDMVDAHRHSHTHTGISRSHALSPQLVDFEHGDIPYFKTLASLLMYHASLLKTRLQQIRESELEISKADWEDHVMQVSMLESEKRERDYQIDKLKKNVADLEEEVRTLCPSFSLSLYQSLTHALVSIAASIERTPADD